MLWSIKEPFKLMHLTDVFIKSKLIIKCIANTWTTAIAFYSHDASVSVSAMFCYQIWTAHFQILTPQQSKRYDTAHLEEMHSSVDTN